MFNERLINAYCSTSLYLVTTNDKNQNYVIELRNVRKKHVLTYKIRFVYIWASEDKNGLKKFMSQSNVMLRCLLVVKSKIKAVAVRTKKINLFDINFKSEHVIFLSFCNGVLM